MNNTKTVSVLNDLLNITNDRIEGFSKVEDNVWHHYPGLRTTYDRMVSQSKVMKDELTQLIHERDGRADPTGSPAGAIHRTWIDVRNAFSRDVATTSLGHVVFGENAAVEAYENALESGDLCPESRKVVLNQLEQLTSSYEKFKNLESLKN